VTEIQQSPLYASYIEKLGWAVDRVENSYVFIKKFPIIGSLVKIQRVTSLPSLSKLHPVLTKYHVGQISVEPDSSIPQKQFDAWCANLTKRVRLMRSPFLPTKTLRIDLEPDEAVIFSRFAEAKRRAVRRAQKNNLQIYKSTNIDEFIRLKNKSVGFLGFITSYGVKKLWQTFPKNQKTILVDTHLTSGILLLFWDKIAYYWLAGATRQGKKLFAPTLLVWEALKLSKKRGCKQFDFVGVWDERTPRQNLKWKGFTKFKEGFGGKPMYYPILR